jgi:hypothetical protein
VVVAVLAVLLAAGLGVEAHRNSTLDATDHRRAAVATTASGLAAALLSYNASDLSASKSRVLALSTPSFATTYEQDFTQALAGTITALGATAVAKVREVYTGPVTDQTAEAIVVVDFQTTSKAGTRQVLGTNLQMDLLRQNGQWRVNAVNVLSAQSETQTTTP